jgi:hypothetical protein
MGCPIIWCSKQQQSVTLSSTEVEYIALSDGTKEIKIVVQVLESIGLKVNWEVPEKILKQTNKQTNLFVCCHLLPEMPQNKQTNK